LGNKMARRTLFLRRYKELWDRNSSGRVLIWDVKQGNSHNKLYLADVCYNNA